ncbi:nucleoside-triphosphatase [Myxococcota bacterium]|nr:nucleoside-triphosphatase [Myxococcota bacterium]
MNTNSCAGLILVTGSPAAGKSRLLADWTARLRRKWQVCGIETAPDASRRQGSKAAAPAYHIRIVGSSQVWPWAVRIEGTDERQYPETTRTTVVERVRPALPVSDVCVFEDLGPQEIAGHGFSGLVDEALSIGHLWVVASAKRTSMADLRQRFPVGRTIVLDLDEHPDPEEVFAFLERELDTRLASRIGACSGLGGLVEVGLGSFLHSFRVPLKGHALAYIQTLLLTTFGRSLHGRGLFRISMLMAMLKAFSPAGRTIRPMFYIFMQGASFALPVFLFGWHLFSVILGAIILNGFTLFLSLVVNYVMFGKSILTAMGNLVGTVAGLFGLELDSWLAGLGFLFLLKAVIAVAVAVAGYYFHLTPRLFHLGRRAGAFLRPKNVPREPQTIRQSALGALRDVFRPTFLLAFLLSILMILFFARLTSGELIFLLIRGLCIAFAGFWLFRRINVQKVGVSLQKRFSGSMAVSMTEALRVLQEDRKDKDADAPENLS